MYWTNLEHNSPCSNHLERLLSLSVCKIAVKNSKLVVLLQHPVQPAELPSPSPISHFPSMKSLLAGHRKPTYKVTQMLLPLTCRKEVILGGPCVLLICQ